MVRGRLEHCRLAVLWMLGIETLFGGGKKICIGSEVLCGFSDLSDSRIPVAPGLPFCTPLTSLAGTGRFSCSLRGGSPGGIFGTALGESDAGANPRIRGAGLGFPSFRLVSPVERDLLSRNVSLFMGVRLISCSDLASASLGALEISTAGLSSLLGGVLKGDILSSATFMEGSRLVLPGIEVFLKGTIGFSARFTRGGALLAVD